MNKLQFLDDPDFLSLSESEQDKIISSAMKGQVDPVSTGVDTASETLVGQLPGMSSVGSLAGEMVDRATQNILDTPRLKGLQEKFPDEQFVTNPEKLPIFGGMIERINSPRKLAREAMGLGIQGAASVVADPLAAKGPALLNRAIAQPIKKTAQSAAARMMNFYIKPRMAAYNFGRNPGMTVAERIGPTMNRASLKNKITVELEKAISNVMEMARANPNNLVDATPVFSSIADSVKNLQSLPRTYQSQMQSHIDFAMDLLDKIRSRAVNSGGKIMISPEDAISLKRSIGEIPSWNVMDPKLGSLTKTSRKAYGALDKSIDAALPGSAVENEAASNLIGAKQGIELGAARENNRWPMGLGLPEIIGGVAAGHGNVLSPEAITTALAIGSVRSAPFNTTVASGLSRGGRAIGSAGRALEYLDRPTMLGEIISSMKPKKGISVASGRPGLPPPTGPGPAAQLKKPIKTPLGIPEPPPAGVGRRAIRVEGPYEQSPSMDMPFNAKRELPAPPPPPPQGAKSKRALRIGYSPESPVIELPSITESKLAELARKYDVPEDIGGIRSTTKAFTSPESKAAMEQALRARRIRMRKRR